MGEKLPIDAMEEGRIYRVSIDFVGEYKGIERTEKGWVLVLFERGAGLVRIPTKLRPDFERV